MLIWIRANIDNLVYTGALINTFIAITIMVFGNYKVGFIYGMGILCLFLLAIVWNE